MKFSKQQKDLIVIVSDLGEFICKLEMNHTIIDTHEMARQVHGSVVLAAVQSTSDMALRIVELIESMDEDDVRLCINTPSHDFVLDRTSMYELDEKNFRIFGER